MVFVFAAFLLFVNENLIQGFPIKALVELSIRPEKNTGYDSIANKIIGFSKVVSHYLVSGQYDFLLVVEGKDHKDIAHFVFDKLATINNVKSTTTHFIFKTYKEQGALMEDSSQGRANSYFTMTYFSNRVKAIPPSGIRAFFDLVMSSKDIISLGVGEPDFYTMGCKR